MFLSVSNLNHSVAPRVRSACETSRVLLPEKGIVHEGHLLGSPRCRCRRKFGMGNVRQNIGGEVGKERHGLQFEYPAFISCWNRSRNLSCVWEFSGCVLILSKIQQISDIVWRFHKFIKSINLWATAVFSFTDYLPLYQSFCVI